MKDSNAPEETSLRAMTTWLRGRTLHQWVQTLLGGWCLFLCGVLLLGDGAYYKIAFAQSLPLPLALLLWGITSATVLLFSRWRPGIEGRVTVFGAIAVALLLTAKAAAHSKHYVYYGLAALLFILLGYAAQQGLLKLPHIRIGDRATTVGVAVLLGLSAAGMVTVGVLRYLTYTTPNYDFGIFAQMFHYMRETLQPLTTCERNGLLSHFAVHVSPVYYLLLPFYALFPSPVTLAVGQGVILASGGIPLYLIARRYALSNKQTLCLLAAYATYPAISCGILFDLHENCFLAPLLLWMFYCYECRRSWPLWVSVFLVLSVKEDAAVYVALFAVYQMVAQRRQNFPRNASLFCVALLYFAVMVLLLEQFGDGAMTNRYAALQYENSGLFGMLKTLFVNPGLFIQQALAPLTKENNKLRYLADLIVPLGLSLLSIRRPSRLLLLTPVLLNLLSSSIYQTDLSFQYNFGVSAFFFYLCALNLRDMEPIDRPRLVSYMAVSSLMLYILLFVPHINSTVSRAVQKHETYARMDEILATVPDDASVTCSAFLLPHLAQRDVVYEDYYHNACDTDYLVLDLRTGYSGKSPEFEQTWRAAGYVEVFREDNLLLILRRAET